NLGPTQARFSMTITQATTSQLGLYDHDANPATPPIVVVLSNNGTYDHDANPMTQGISVPFLVDDELEFILQNNGSNSANAGLFPFLRAGTVLITTRGFASLANTPNAGFNGNGFRFN